MVASDMATPEWIAATQSSLGKYIKAPPLTEKLLSKPPFKFLFDIVMSVSKVTGFSKGLYNDGELDFESGNKEEVKERKVKFLERIFGYVSYVIKAEVTTDVKKVLAGKDPESTNVFLQQLAEAIANGADNNDALIKKYSSSSRKSSSKHRERKDRPEKTEEPPPKQNGHSPPEDAPQEPPAAESKVKIPRPTSAKGQRRTDEARGKPTTEKPDSKPAAAAEPEKKESKPKRPQEAGRSARGHQRTPANAHEQPAAEPAAPPPRPKSRMPPPPMAQAAVETNLGRTIGAGSTTAIRDAPDAPRRTTVIVDKTNEKDSDDEDDFVVQEVGGQNNDVDFGGEQRTMDGGDVAPSAEHGALVQKMLDQKQQAAQQAKASGGGGDSIVTDSQARKRRDLVCKEMNRIGGGLQSLSRLVAPTARLVDFLQEDLDSMHREAAKWTEEYRLHLQKLRKEETVTWSAVEPLRAQLAELEKQVQDKMDEIASTRCNIMHNEQRLAAMLDTVTKVT